MVPAFPGQRVVILFLVIAVCGWIGLLAFLCGRRCGQPGISGVLEDSSPRAAELPIAVLARNQLAELRVRRVHGSHR